MELQCITIHTCGRNCRLYFLAQYGFRFQSASIHLSVHSVEVGKMLFWLVFVWHDHSLISRMFCHHTHWVGPKFRVRVHEKYFISFLHHMMWILCIDMIQPFEYWREMATSFSNMSKCSLPRIYIYFWCALDGYFWLHMMLRLQSENLNPKNAPKSSTPMMTQPSNTILFL